MTAFLVQRGVCVEFTHDCHDSICPILYVLVFNELNWNSFGLRFWRRVRLAQGVWREIGLYGVCICGWKRLWLWGGGRIAVLDKEEKLEELFPPSCIASFALLSVILEHYFS